MQLLGPPVNEHRDRDSGRRETFGQSSHPLDLTYGRTHENVEGNKKYGTDNRWRVKGPRARVPQRD